MPHATQDSMNFLDFQRVMTPANWKAIERRKEQRRREERERKGVSSRGSTTGGRQVGGRPCLESWNHPGSPHKASPKWLLLRM